MQASSLDSSGEHGSTEEERSTPHHQRSMKCVVIGDAAVGKTSLLTAITLKGDASALPSSAVQEFRKRITLDQGEAADSSEGDGPLVVDITFVDTAGELHNKRGEEHYPSADVFLLCFSIISPSSFQSVLNKWYPTVREHNKTAPLVLVGMKVDLRYDQGILTRLQERRMQPVTEREGKELQRKIEAKDYFEVSVSEIEVLELLVTEVVREAVGKTKGKKKRKKEKKKSRRKSSSSKRGSKEKQKEKEKESGSSTNGLDEEDERGQLNEEDEEDGHRSKNRRSACLLS
ncbi:Ras-related C3 botulinum toxin substrate 2 [Balamuthia mandrillaris]